MKRLIILFFILKVVAVASIGEITAINGSAFIVRGASEIPLYTHSKIETKDTIKTMKNSKLQIVFNDKTIISLGQKTIFRIDEYLFSRTEVKVNFNISKGLFKSITGKIGKIAPQNFKLHTQNATIGVRGTTIIGETSRDGDNIICSSGKIVVTSQLGEVVVNRGERTIVKQGHKPTSAVKLTKNQILTMDKKVKPKNTKVEIQMIKPINTKKTDKYTTENNSNINIQNNSQKINTISTKINTTQSTTMIKTKKISNIAKKSSTEIIPKKQDISNSLQNISKPKFKKIDKTIHKFKNISKPKFKNIVHKTPTIDNTVVQNIAQNAPATVSVVTQNIADTVSDNINQVAPIVQNMSQNTPDTISTVVQDITDNWGDWSTQNNQEEDLEQPSIDNPNTSSFQDLIDRAGDQTPTYKGTISSTSRNPFKRISSQHNEINLNFDLGDGTLNGNLKFKTIRDNWAADITNGTVNRNGAFDFDLQNTQDNIQGSGKGSLSGGALEHANGSFTINKNEGKNISANFQATKQ